VLVAPKEMVVFRDRDGGVPLENWLDELNDKRAVARVLARLARVRQGNLGDCKSVGEGVSELRVDYGPGYRIYFGQKGKTLVVLLCGGIDERRIATFAWQNASGTNSRRVNYENGKLQKNSTQEAG
jgi:putative addiction module killer protein